MTGGADVVICGGGLMGTAAAYLLAKEGVRPLVLEMDAIGSGSSGGSAGILGLNIWEANHPLESLKRESKAIHENLSHMLPRESALDYEYAQVPFLLPAFTLDDVESMRTWVASREGLRWLDELDARAACPWLGAEALGGLYQQQTGQVNSYKLTLSLISAAERRGATVRSGRVTGIRLQGSRALAVEVENEVISAGQILLTMGPWTAAAQSWLGIPLPVKPLKGQLLKLRLQGAVPWCGIWYRNDYVMPKVEGLITVGTTREAVGFDTSLTQEARDHITQAALRMAPVLASASLVEHTACLRPVSGDGLPLIGKVPGYENVYVCTGHGESGTVLSTGSAAAIVEVMTAGAAQSVDLSAFDPARFVRH